MGIKDFFNPKEQLVALDIGSGNIKMLEIDISQSGKPQLLKLSLVSFKENIFSNNVIVKQDIVADAVGSLFSDNNIKDQRVLVCVPGPSALIKKIRIPKDRLPAVREQVMLEAGNLLPGGLNDVRIDFHILDLIDGEKYDILVVAVKDEVVNSYLDSLMSAAVDVAVIDVDYYAISNSFELNYPELKEGLTAIIDVGSRFSNIILRKGEEILYAGDASIGSRPITDELMERYEVDFSTAESYKCDPNAIEDETLREEVTQFLAEKVKSLAEDFSRQIKLFWGSSGSEEEVGHIFLTGGGALITGFRSALEEKSSVSTFIFDPFRGLEVNLDIDDESLAKLAPLFTVAVGLGLRQAGDRVIP